MFKNNLLKKVTSVAATVAAVAVPFLSLASFSAPVASANTSGAKLELTNVVDKTVAQRGGTLNYTLTVKNTGTVDTTNTFLWINQPNLADYVAGSSNYQGFPGGTLKTLTDSWITDGVNFGTLPAGKYIVLKYQTKVIATANDGDILWSVSSVKSDQTNSVQANSWTRATFENPGICAEKTADKSTVSIGDTVNFTIKVCNTGNIVLHNVYIGDIIHSPLQYVANSTVLSVPGETDKTIDDNWLNTGVNIGPLNPGQSAFLKFQVKVTDSLTDGQVIQNVAQVKSDETPNILQCSVVLKGKVLGIVTIAPTPVKPLPQLPNTGPGDVLLLGSLIAPAGWLLKKFKSKI